MKRSLRFKPLHVSISVRDGYLYEVQRRGNGEEITLFALLHVTLTLELFRHH